MPKTCMVVADDPKARAHLRAVAETLEFSVREAASFHEARDLLTPIPDLLLLVDNEKDTSVAEVLEYIPPTVPHRMPKAIFFQEEYVSTDRRRLLWRIWQRRNPNIILLKKNLYLEDVGQNIEALFRVTM